MKAAASVMRGTGLLARALRSAAWHIGGYGGGQFLRLVSNLILTRLLFPEAFGLMSLVTVILTGLNLFSDTGVGLSIRQSKRGDDPDFLNSAWTIQIIRGVLLFFMACLLAQPVADFYGEQDLARYLPIAAIALIIAGFNPTRIETANRHLVVGRLTLLDLISQVFGLVFMVALAMATGSVIAMVLGGVAHAIAKLVLTHFFLPGERNRLCWDKRSVHELLHFGKWIFLSTALAFLIGQGDRLILGRFLSLEMLGIYNIGFFLGAFPASLGHAVVNGLLVPIYRESHENQTRQRKIRLVRVAFTAGIGTMLVVMAMAGPAIVSVLYDDRYALAGPIVTLIALTLLPQTIIVTYDSAALTAGDSRSFFVWILARAILQSLCVLYGVTHMGVTGAILGLGASVLLAYPAIVWLARKHNVWDPMHDILAAVAFCALTGLVLSYHHDHIAQLAVAI